ncbi:MAG: TonB-dependent receptor [Pseudomonadota bacterium]
MKKRDSIRALALSSSALFALVGLSAPALAQDDPVTVNTSADEDDTAVQDRIIVTGSRIATDSNLTAASPVLTVDADSIVTSGEVDVSALLRDIPALQGSFPGSFSATADAFDGEGDQSDVGLSLLDLRDLGIERTLVLQDGRRHVPGTGGQAAVDVNAIPTSLIKRVDVLTGGASSIYGADAVSGVVNFVLRDGRDFDGLEYRIQTGISDEGDAEEIFASIANGGQFDNGRGSGVFAVEFSHATSVLEGDRDFAGPGLSSFTQSIPSINTDLGLDPNASNAFFPDLTLPFSSALGLINVTADAVNDPASAFNVAAGLINDFTPGVDTLPLVAGTNIPVAQVVDPTTGDIRPFNPGRARDGFASIGGDSITAGNSPLEILLPEQTRALFNAGGDYELTEHITFFAEGKFVFTETTDQAGIPFTDDIPIEIDNPFLPAGLQAQVQSILSNGGTPGIAVSRDITDENVLFQTNAERTTIRTAAGFRGTIPGLGFDYEASYTWGRTEIDVVSTNNRLEDRYFTAIDAVALTADTIADVSGTVNAIRGGQDIQIDSGTAQVGDIVCRSEITGLPARSNTATFGLGAPPVFDDGTTLNGVDVSQATRPVTFNLGDGQCAPLNILGLNSIGGAGADFAFQDLTDRTVLTQEQILISVSGDSSQFFELPAGPIGFAVGFEWRDDTSIFTPDSFRTLENIVANSAVVNPSPITTDEFPDTIDVIEGFFELQVPLLRDLPFAELLEVTGSARFSDYNTIGSTEAWSIGGRYQPHDWITFRGTYSEAVRAPNIGELFGPITSATIGVGDDPCDDGNINAGSAFRAANCANFVADGFNDADFLGSFVFGTTGGNPGLLEEEADTFTVGTVIQPGGLFEGLTLVADFYDIEIANAIGSLTGEQIAEACVDLPTINNQFCDNVFRNPANGGAISGFSAGNINLASLAVQGVDWSAAYEFEVPNYGGRDLGTMRLSAVGTRFIEDIVDGDPASAEVIAGITDPLEQELAQVNLDVGNDELGELTRPEWIATFGVNWDLGRLGLNWTGRFESSQNADVDLDNGTINTVAIVDGAVTVSPTPNIADPSQLRTGNGFIQDVGFNYEVSEKLNFYGGINNFLDEDPFLGQLARPVGPRGRFFFIGVQGQF